MVAAGIIHFDAVVNFRDVGLYTNAASGTKRLKTGLLFRSARPDYATPSDQDTLNNSLHIRTIIDLRSNTERRHATRPQHNETGQVPPASVDEASAALLPRPALLVPGSLSPSITTTHINLNGSLFSLRLILSLPLLSALHLIFLYLLGQRIRAIRILSTVIGPRGLSELARDSLLSSWREIRSVFGSLSKNDNWPVLIHCTQGKDRTGLVVLLVGLLCGVELDALVADYEESGRALEPGREERVAEIREVGLPDDFADVQEGWVESTAAFIEERWGGVESYLMWCGVSAAEMAAVKDILIDE